MKPTCCARQWANSASSRAAMSTPATRMLPLSALSMPASRLSRVLFPEPDGPINARNSPSAISKLMSCRTGISWLTRRAPSLFRHLHPAAVLQLVQRLHGDLLPRLHPARHLHQVADGRAEGH